MQLVAELRLGIGFDIEHNESNCYVITTDDGDSVCAYSGLIITLPFFKIHIGDFYDLEVT